MLLLLSLLHDGILDLIVEQRQHNCELDPIELLVSDYDILSSRTAGLLQSRHGLFLQNTWKDERFHALYTLV